MTAAWWEALRQRKKGPRARAHTTCNRAKGSISPGGKPCTFRCREEVTESFRREGHEVIDVDGARIQFPSGWGLVRASNTQPVLVARCEGKTPEALACICEVVREAIVRVGGLEDFR